MTRRRPPRQEPVRCICEPGADAAMQHGKPGAKAPVHLARCPHSELAHTTKPAPKRATGKRLRLQQAPALPRTRRDATGEIVTYDPTE